MSLLEHAPRYDVGAAVRLAHDLYRLEVSASSLPSERDQNFLLTTAAGDRFVLKIANATETRPLLEAQNAALNHLACRVDLTPRVLPTIDGETIGMVPRNGHMVRLVTYLAGTPLAVWRERSTALLESLGRALGRIDAALADFDHPAIHRSFHWDLANAAAVIGERVALVGDDSLRSLVSRASALALEDVARRQAAFRRSAIHHDANDWNVLVGSTSEVTGIVDFGDMVYSWTVGEPAVAVAYAMLDANDPLTAAAAIVRGYDNECPLRDEELTAVFPLAILRLCMSACIAAWQQRQRPDDEYLTVSQEPIQRTLPLLAAITTEMAVRTLRSACERTAGA